MRFEQLDLHLIGPAVSDRIEALQNLAFLMREKIGKPNELFLYLDQVAQILQDLNA
jgi:hypothetical protein